MNITLATKNEKFLFAGLGNPGKKYQSSRHNSGFMFIDFLKEYFDSKTSLKTETNNKDYSLIHYPELNIYLLKPLELMNLSGKAIKKVLKYNNIDTNNLILVHDDLDINLGKHKIQSNKSPLKHNGVISTEKEIGTKDFYRVRIGIDNREEGNQIPGSKYVLLKMNRAELVTLENEFKKILAELIK